MLLFLRRVEERPAPQRVRRVMDANSCAGLRVAWSTLLTLCFAAYACWRSRTRNALKRRPLKLLSRIRFKRSPNVPKLISESTIGPLFLGSTRLGYLFC